MNDDKAALVLIHELSKLVKQLAGIVAEQQDEISKIKDELFKDKLNRFYPGLGEIVRRV